MTTEIERLAAMTRTRTWYESWIAPKNYLLVEEIHYTTADGKPTMERSILATLALIEDLWVPCLWMPDNETCLKGYVFATSAMDATEKHLILHAPTS